MNKVIQKTYRFSHNIDKNVTDTIPHLSSNPFPSFSEASCQLGFLTFVFLYSKKQKNIK